MSKRVLIADDSLTIQRAFAMSFAGEDLALLTARSADEGLTVARQARPDLVIADAVMPGRSGYDLAQAIKSDPSLRGVPVYILASAHNPYDEGRGRQSGVDGSFTKPFESVALIERVREAIAKGTTASVPAAAARPPLTSVPAAAPAPAGRNLDEDYGEISIDAAAGRGDPASEVTPPPREPLPPRSVPPAVPPAAGAASPGLRPSLIPGLRPGAAPPPARPGMTMSPRPAPGASAQQPPSLFPPVGHATAPAAPAAYAPPGQGAPGSGVRPPLPQTATATPAPARTLVGLPATLAHAQQRLGVPSAPARPPTQPVRTLDGRTPAPYPHPVGLPPGAAPPGAQGRLESQVDQKIAQIAARGAEYEAIAKLSREIIEKIVWEVVPELAEVIVREELQKRGRI